MQRLRSWENYGKTFRKTSYTLAFSWSRKTIDKYHVFMTLTVSNSVGKHVENEAFAHTGKLQKNFQENRLFIGIFLVQGNMWWTSCFSWVLPRVNGKFAIRFQISENISMMSNFSVFHHFGKLTMNKGFCAVYAQRMDGYMNAWMRKCNHAFTHVWIDGCMRALEINQ